MKKALLIAALVVAADALCPDIHLHAQAAIAPVVLAAIISAAGSMASSMGGKGGGGLQAPRGGGIDMSPSSKMQEEVNKAMGADQLAGAPGSFAPLAGGVATPKINQPNVQSNVVPFATGNMPPSSGGSGNPTPFEALGPPLDPSRFNKDGTPIESKGMDFDQKMQLAAMAASLGSALAGPGAPNPPGAPRGGGIQMQPAFMTARQIYG